MKTLIILVCLIINTGLYAQAEGGKDEIDELDKPAGTEESAKKERENLTAKISYNYLGVNLIYNMATLINPEIQNSGFGGDLFYQSYLSNPWSYKIQIGFLYNHSFIISILRML